MGYQFFIRFLLIFSCVTNFTRTAAEELVKDKKINYEVTESSIELRVEDVIIFKHTNEHPAVRIGLGKGKYKNDLGNFKIREELLEYIELTKFAFEYQSYIIENKETTAKSGFFVASNIKFYNPEYTNEQVILKFELDESTNQVLLSMSDKPKNASYNRFYLRMPAKDTEHIYGGGEQYTHFDLKGHDFPIWGREQGVGRDKTVVSFLAELIAGAGGDYHTTYWPQSTFVSSQISLEYNEIELWEDFTTFKIYLRIGKSWPELISKLTNFLGRQPRLPDWIFDGTILGLQGGLSTVMDRYNQAKKEGIRVSALWIQDWSGKLVTYLGKRVYWNWYLSEELYSWEFKSHAQEMKRQGIRFLSYINPHVINGSDMFQFADKNGYFIQDKNGKSHLVDFGDFYCATVDLTNPMAYKWYKDVLRDMVDAGFSGWMADFGGEYLPVVDDEIVYYDKAFRSSSMHNYYNYLWARLNREVVDENNELFVFMRSGFGASGGQAPSAWAGDQNVDFTKGDGLASVIPATLSLGMSGMGVVHSDIGGYVSLLCMVRTEELILRWAEMSVFSPVMRTHEGNRPDRNWQVYTTNSTMKKLARLTHMFAALKSYHTHVNKENEKFGLPSQRPLFFHYSDDEESFNIKYQYLYGQDLLVAPVIEEGERTKEVYLPPDSWVFLWDQDKMYSGGKNVKVPSPVGQIPVFYRSNSKWNVLFQNIGKTYKMEAAVEPQGLSWSLWNENPLIFLYLFLRFIFYYILLKF